MPKRNKGEPKDKDSSSEEHQRYQTPEAPRTKPVDIPPSKTKTKPIHKDERPEIQEHLLLMISEDKKPPQRIRNQPEVKKGKKEKKCKKEKEKK